MSQRLKANQIWPMSYRVLASVFLCEIALLAVYWFDYLSGQQFQLLHALFDMDSEGNIPAWFSSSQLLLTAVTFWIAAFKQKRGKRPSKVFFALAGLAALYVSSDETAQIHERVTGWMGMRYVDWLPSYAANNFGLVMIAVAVLVTACQLLAEDLIAFWTNYRPLSLLIILGIVVGLTGGMGVETLGYKFLQKDTVWYQLEVALEEFMEMFGASLVLFSALNLSRRSVLLRARSTAETRSVRTTCLST